MRIEIRNAEVDGIVRDVVLASPAAAWSNGSFLEDDLTLDARGGALIPGLHDHHLHLLAMAASSIDVGPARDLADLGALLRAAPPGWVRARGYHESIAGELDRTALDRILPDRPVRMQHRSGALWMLNSAALDQVRNALDDSPDVERDRDGEPTGRLWRYDTRLRAALPETPVDLARAGQELFSLGITGITDATPDLEPGAIALLNAAVRSGDLPQTLTLLGVPDDWAPPTGGLRVHAGPAKLLLRDHDLPDVTWIADWIAARHAAARPVAVHCVSSDSLILTMTALQIAGVLPGDRIEHAAVVPSGLRPDLGALGVRVVTQPDFLRTRGDDYLRDVPASEVPFLYPYCSLLDCGVPTAPSSDAPYGDPDPWQIIASAHARLTASGQPIAATESVSTRRALEGFLSPAHDPGGTPKRLHPGPGVDVVLLSRPLDAALAEPRAGDVRLVSTRAELRFP